MSTLATGQVPGRRIPALPLFNSAMTSHTSASIGVERRGDHPASASTTCGLDFDGQPSWSGKPEVAATTGPVPGRHLRRHPGVESYGNGRALDVFTPTSWIGLPRCVIRPKAGT